MIITSIETRRQAVKLKKPFKTALRTVEIAYSVIVSIRCENGMIGWGEAPPTLAITGESLESIESAILHTIRPQIIGQSLFAYEKVFHLIHQSSVGNGSAKAAIDMALYDLLSQGAGMPLYQFLGGYRNTIETDYTVSVNEPEEMGEDAVEFVKDGFNVLKIKVGKDEIKKDIERISEIRKRIGYGIKVRLDANQGWEVKEAISSIRKMEDMGLDIELIEQPVKAYDLEGLKIVSDAVETPIMADESIFTPQQAFQVLKNRAVDLINIKLMKSGGIFKAQVINSMAEACGVECMVGSMIESKVGLTAAAHFAASKKNITRYDFDAPLLLSEDPVQGGIIYEGRTITLPNAPGLGISNVK
ncbi:MAG: dipeptide epimerase [Bacilli bacterium]